MDDFTTRVSHFVCDIKKAILPRFYNKLQSPSGHGCMRTYGPIIAAAFYMTQGLHAFLFLTVFGPALHQRFEDNQALAHLLQLIGWLLCLKVTYLYYKVN